MESKVSDLTARQTEILRLIAQGHTAYEIAQILELRVGTVRTHTENVYQVLQVNNRIEAAILALGTVIDLREAQATVMKRCWAVDIN